MVIIPLGSSFGLKSEQEKNTIINELQMHSRGAGLKGMVVPVWESSGRTHFIAPRPWHPFFESMPLQQIWANINKELSW